MKGICGTCCHVAEATFENQGYSSCCNDRIEYGYEAELTALAEIEYAQEQLESKDTDQSDLDYWMAHKSRVEDALAFIRQS